MLPQVPRIHRHGGVPSSHGKYRKPRPSLTMRRTALDSAWMHPRRTAGRTPYDGGQTFRYSEDSMPARSLHERHSAAVERAGTGPGAGGASISKRTARPFRAAMLAALPLALLAAACASSSNNSARSNAGGPSAAGAPVGASLTATPASGAATAVEIKNISFPATISVKPGTTVSWTNRDTVSHTVTADAGQAQSFDSGPIAPNGSFSVTFAKAGTYTYHCNIHASMHGTIVVGDQAGGVSTPAAAPSSTPYDPGYKY
ncbi:MAG TPA: cupredoxin family copper-binding protein [Dehalococcoidia bacterium]